MADFKIRTLAEAKAEVEAVLLAESKGRGEVWTDVDVNLWYSGDPAAMANEGNTLFGIRVASIDWSKKPHGYAQGNLGGYCGCSTSDLDSPEALMACAAAERAILNRCCYWEVDDDSQQWQVSEADATMLQAVWYGEEEPEPQTDLTMKVPKSVAEALARVPTDELNKALARFVKKGDM